MTPLPTGALWVSLIEWSAGEGLSLTSGRQSSGVSAEPRSACSRA